MLARRPAMWPIETFADEREAQCENRWGRRPAMWPIGEAGVGGQGSEVS